ncbi:MAG: hypothetical protein KAG66_21795 [Methylococcales bacterium]|nr:hypothetical protein [Methylococcales bacterium]
MDMQLPRWAVFKQDNEKRTHQMIGSVHAAGSEHALHMARNVFVRRPSAVSIWVAPYTAVTTWTAAEIAAADEVEPISTGQVETYAIFHKKSHRRAMTFVDYLGEVEANSPQAALSAGIATFSKTALAWLVVPRKLVAMSDGSSIEGWYAPAEDKTYRHQATYGSIGLPHKD